MKEITYDTNELGCMLVNSHRQNESGHVQVRRNKKLVYLHRYVYEQEVGVIPEGMVVRHKCDNPNCINKEHLELGSVSDNVNDRVKRDRSATGTSNGRSKLTTQDAKYIKYNNELSNYRLAKMFNVDAKTIVKIKQGITWKDI